MTSYYVPVGTMKLEDGMFPLEGYRRIVLPEGVIRIGDYALWGNDTLEEIVLPRGLEEIGSCAFSDCTALKRVVIPSGVRCIGHDAFSGCTSLEEVVFQGWGPRILEDGTFLHCKSLARVVLPSELAVLGSELALDGVFEGCRALTEITLPPSVRFVGCGTFSDCTLLRKLDLPEGLVGIGECALKGTSVREIVVPEGVETFWNVAPSCKKLERIVLPSTIRKLSYMVFSGYPKLKELVLPLRFEGDMRLYCPPDRMGELEIEYIG